MPQGARLDCGLPGHVCCAAVGDRPEFALQGQATEIFLAVFQKRDWRNSAGVDVLAWLAQSLALPGVTLEHYWVCPSRLSTDNSVPMYKSVCCSQFLEIYLSEFYFLTSLLLIPKGTRSFPASSTVHGVCLFPFLQVGIIRLPFCQIPAILKEVMWSVFKF